MVHPCLVREICILKAEVDCETFYEKFWLLPYWVFQRAMVSILITSLIVSGKDKNFSNRLFETIRDHQIQLRFASEEKIQQVFRIDNCFQNCFSSIVIMEHWNRWALRLTTIIDWQISWKKPCSTLVRLNAKWGRTYLQCYRSSRYFQEERPWRKL